jgi:hypothetical protein
MKINNLNCSIMHCFYKNILKMSSNIGRIVVLMAFFGLPATLTHATTYYVKPISTGTGNGSSWANASNNLQDLINNASAASSDQIWVAAGTYLPTQDPFGSTSPTDPRDKTFYLKSEIKVYGSFFGDETTLAARHGGASILSGDIGTPLSKTDNAYHVVITVLDAATTLLDGFVVTGGYANGTGNITVEGSGFLREKGAGVYYANGSTTLTNCVLTANETTGTGGGLFADVGAIPNLNTCAFASNLAGSGGGGYFYGAHAVIVQCLFQNNVASGDGGALFSFGANCSLTKCILMENTAVSGGGLFNNASTPVLTNCVIANNTAVNGGGMLNSDGSPLITNSTIANNSASGNGGGLFNNFNSVPVLKNTIVSNNTGNGTQGIYNNNGGSPALATYSIIQGTTVYTGTGNSNDNPYFVAPSVPKGADGSWFTADDGFQLGVCSAATDAGTNTATPAIDILNNAIYNTTKDIGAYERQTESCAVYSGAATCQTFTATNVTGNQWFKIVGTNGIVAALHPNGSDLGTITVEISDPTGAVMDGGNPFLGRIVNITSSNYASGATIPNPYTLKLYYFDSELTEYGAGATLSQLGFLWKEGGTGCTLATYAETQKGSLLATNVTKAEYGAGNNGFSLAFQLNHFTLFAATASSAVLPIELVDFNGQKTENGTQLSWQTASETRFSHFDIERSLNGTLFEKIGETKANGSNSNYTFIDPNPFNTMYYRLKINDLDGKFEFSKIISIETQSSNGVRIKPTFVNDVLTVEGATSYEIVDGTGRVLLQSLENQLNVQSLPQGFYVVRGRDVVGNPFIQKIIKN